ncbi:hypothetical protein N7508_003010 [Penicillium antarcticum]|uniref:uncharacterized protein n=1 Tax=Penicillium antarcticum TaxID=416450 RepID=UPI002393F3FD|nr:uncharacterized protein N7508_003010 [Penicillium antarcticum]KAJ5312180.1 hypothetical protein N7508_003010 [Penicillium antarcticum]
MSALDPKTLPDITGTWILNRKYSTDPEEVFALQGVPWIVRKALKHARLSLQLWQTTSNESSGGETDSTTSSESVTRLRLKQVVSPGNFDSEGAYPLDGSLQELSLPIFGDLTMRLQYINTSEILEDTIREKLVKSSVNKEVIQELAKNSLKGWDAEVIWGFEEIDGNQYLTRNISTTKGNDKVIARMVYHSEI